MKKFLTAAAVLVLVACGEKKAAAPAADSAASAAPAADSGMKGMKMDSTMARDTAKKM
jgi:hypothetical protein